MRRNAAPIPDVRNMVRQWMARIAKSATRPEMLVSQALRSLGVDYRFTCRDLPGTTDLGIIRRREAILVHGYF